MPKDITEELKIVYEFMKNNAYDKNAPEFQSLEAFENHLRSTVGSLAIKKKERDFWDILEESMM